MNKEKRRERKRREEKVVPRGRWKRKKTRESSRTGRSEQTVGDGVIATAV
jgi:hypothetical protein